MDKQEDYTLMKIFVNETIQYKGQPIHRVIVKMLTQEKIQGATVLRGIMGFGAERQVHTADILRLSVKLPFSYRSCRYRKQHRADSTRY